MNFFIEDGLVLSNKVNAYVLFWTQKWKMSQLIYKVNGSNQLYMWKIMVFLSKILCKKGKFASYKFNKTFFIYNTSHS